MRTVLSPLANCSGAMYAMVPTTSPGSVSVSSSGAAESAMPKSARMARPSSRKDVRRLDITMDDAVTVGLRERIEEIRPDREDFVERQRSSVESRAQGFTGNEVHHVVLHAVDFAGVMDGNDIGVAQPGEDASLANETR